MSQQFCFTSSLVPKPLSVVLTSDPLSPIRPIGSNVTLTCTIELSLLVNVPVTVNTEWTGPDGFMTTNIAQRVNIGSTTTYTSKATVFSFRRTHSGKYICSAAITSLSPFLLDSDTSSATSTITVGKLEIKMKTLISAAAAVATNDIIIINRSMHMCRHLSFSERKNS